MNTWLSVVIPTACERQDGLQRTLESIRAQDGGDQIEVLVVADTHAVSDRGRFDESSRAVETFRGRWLECDAGLHCVGQPQRTAGARAAGGDWVAFSQDDNCLTRDSLVRIWLAIWQQERPRPLFFKIRTHWGQIVWGQPLLALGNIDADCIVLPRALAQEVTWGLRYEGDFDAASDACRLAGGEVGWCDDLIAMARPAPEDWWWRLSPRPQAIP